jgi:hypothetical protein
MKVAGAGLEINVYITECSFEGEEERVGCVTCRVDVVCIAWRHETHAYLETVIQRVVSIEICVGMLQNKQAAECRLCKFKRRYTEYILRADKGGFKNLVFCVNHAKYCGYC